MESKYTVLEWNDPKVKEFKGFWIDRYQEEMYFNSYEEAIENYLEDVFLNEIPKNERAGYIHLLRARPLTVTPVNFLRTILNDNELGDDYDFDKSWHKKELDELKILVDDWLERQVDWLGVLWLSDYIVRIPWELLDEEVDQ